MRDEGDKILHLMRDIMRNYYVDSNIKNRGFDEKIELIVEANDNILERAANNLDEMNGIKKAPSQTVILQTASATLPVSGSWNRQDKILSSKPSLDRVSTI